MSNQAIPANWTRGPPVLQPFVKASPVKYMLTPQLSHLLSIGHVSQAEHALYRVPLLAGTALVSFDAQLLFALLKQGRDMIPAIE
jgi:hypothetical protein